MKLPYPFLISFFLFLGINCPNTLADTVTPPRPFRKTSPNGKFVFVNIPPKWEEGSRPIWNNDVMKEIREILKNYSRTGLYRNDGSKEPLWTVDWYEYGVDVASDGIHLIRHGRVAGSIHQEAISFFANGELLKSYQIADLVDFPKFLSQSVWIIRWYEKIELNDSDLTFHVTTGDGNSFVFDVRTGEILSKTPSIWLIFWRVGQILGIGLLLVMFWRWSGKKRRSPQEEFHY